MGKYQSKVEVLQNLGSFCLQLGKSSLLVPYFLFYSMRLIRHHVIHQQTLHLFLYDIFLLLQIFLELQKLQLLAVLPQHLLSVANFGHDGRPLLFFLTKLTFLAIGIHFPP
jgi:hypothetical protein